MMTEEPAPSAPPSWTLSSFIFALATVIVGVLTGLAASALTILLEYVERFSFGASEHDLAHAISGASSLRVSTAVICCGLIGALCWYALRRWGKPLVSVGEAMDGKTMPARATLMSVILQVAQVGAGASVGRENAPREAGALCANRMARFLQLDREQARILIAAAAGAGLAAAYHLPLAGAIFALEVLAIGISIRAVATAVTCSAVATVTEDHIVHVGIQYHTVAVVESWPYYLFALVIGLIVGALGSQFRIAARWASQRAPRDRRVLWQMPLGFGVMAMVAYWLPDIVGNGRFSALQVLEFNANLPLIVALFFGNLFAVLICLRVGAVGGTLTPGFCLGALAASIVWFIVYGINPMLVTHVSLAGCAVIGGASFLATSTAAPLFAMVVAAEFTGQGPAAYPALFLAVGAASLGGRFFAETNTSESVGSWVALFGRLRPNDRTRSTHSEKHDTFQTEL